MALFSVNALNGLLLISTSNIDCKGETLRCVNALNGLLLISTNEENKKFKQQRECQCPQRASTHFYAYLLGWFWGAAEGVNALNGLLLISTVASRKP